MDLDERIHVELFFNEYVDVRKDVRITLKVKPWRMRCSSIPASSLGQSSSSIVSLVPQSKVDFAQSIQQLAVCNISLYEFLQTAFVEADTFGRGEISHYNFVCFSEVSQQLIQSGSA